MRNYSKYSPIPTEDLPAQFAGIFHMLALTFAPANDRTIIATIDGRNLELICDGGDTATEHRKKIPVVPPAIKKPSGSSAKGIFATARHSKGSGVETQTRPTMRAKGSSSIHGIP